jgi:hypothetical protein
MKLPMHVVIGSMSYYKLVRETLSADATAARDAEAEFKIAACESAISSLESGVDEEIVWRSYLDVLAEWQKARQRWRLFGNSVRRRRWRRATAADIERSRRS